MGGRKRRDQKTNDNRPPPSSVPYLSLSAPNAQDQGHPHFVIERAPVGQHVLGEVHDDGVHKGGRDIKVVDDEIVKRAKLVAAQGAVGDV